MPRFYDMLDMKAIDELLTTLSPDAVGKLPFRSFTGTPQWQLLLKNHSEVSIKSAMLRRWKERVKPVVPASVPTVTVPLSTKETQKPILNHAYNFCPACGFKLN